MKNIISIVVVSCAIACFGDQWSAIERPISGDRVVLNDSEYVLFSVSDFEAFTNKMTVLVSMARRQWNEQHKTESGRREWHGQKVSTVISTNEAGKIVKTIEYSDGYKFVEESETAKRNTKKNSAIIRNRINDIPKRKRDAVNGVNFVKEVK